MLRICALLGTLLCLASMLSATPITYAIEVNTSSISGTSGSLDFNFNPGPLVTQAASLQILSFGGNGTVAGSRALTGDVTGVLPGTLTFDNGTGFNDYFEDFTFGSTIAFQLSFYGPALSSPDGVSSSGSTFAFSMFSDSAGTVPALTSDLTDGFAFLVNVNLDGTTTVTNYSLQTTVDGQASSEAPEPGISQLIEVGIGLICLSMVRRRVASERSSQSDASLVEK